MLRILSLGEDLLLPAIAAVCLGGTSLFGGVGGITGTAVGSLILALIVNGMNLLGVQTFWQSGVMGAIILDFGAGRSTWRNAAGAPAVRLIRRDLPASADRSQRARGPEENALM